VIDDKSLIQCDGNSTYMCDTSSSVNKKIYDKCGNIHVSRSQLYIRVAGSEIGNHPEWDLALFLTLNNGISHLLRSKAASSEIH